jgi:hypothetical protein
VCIGLLHVDLEYVHDVAPVGDQGVGRRRITQASFAP